MGARAAGIAWLAVGGALMVGAAPTAALAQDAWVLAGVDAALHERWRATSAVGYLGGFDCAATVTDVTFIAAPAVQVLVGHVYLRPLGTEAATTMLRAGGMWLLLRGRVAIDNRLLIERRWTAPAEPGMRARDRLRTSWRPGEREPLRVFAAFEALAVHGSRIERRFQTGVMRPVGPVQIEVAWLRRRSSIGSVLNALTTTVYWRLDVAAMHSARPSRR